MAHFVLGKEVLGTQEKKEHLARTYGLDVSLLRGFGYDTVYGKTFVYRGCGWDKDTKFYVTKDGKAGIL